MMQLPTLVIMGVSGCGKSTVGALLAERMHREFVDGDDLHPEQNRQRMAAGNPLDDEHRWPWLRQVAQQIGRWEAAGTPGIVACSALKRSYRDHIREEAGRPPLFVHLDVPETELADRLARRTGHFMPPALLASQLQELERPCAIEPVLRLQEIITPQACCTQILAQADSLVTAMANYTPEKSRPVCEG